MYESTLIDGREGNTIMTEEYRIMFNLIDQNAKAYILVTLLIVFSYNYTFSLSFCLIYHINLLVATVHICKREKNNRNDQNGCDN